MKYLTFLLMVMFGAMTAFAEVPPKTSQYERWFPDTKVEGYTVFGASFPSFTDWPINLCVANRSTGSVNEKNDLDVDIAKRLYVKKKTSDDAFYVMFGSYSMDQTGIPHRRPVAALVSFHSVDDTQIKYRVTLQRLAPMVVVMIGLDEEKFWDHFNKSVGISVQDPTGNSVFKFKAGNGTDLVQKHFNRCVKEYKGVYSPYGTAEDKKEIKA